MPETKAPSAKGLLDKASKSAREVQPRDIGEVIAGPFDVGNIGSVSVVKRQSPRTGDEHLIAVYQPQSGRVQRMPLAAVAALAETLD